MSPSPSPILPLTVHTLLHHILPTSQLVLPLPSHLLSHPLRLRHHFLHPATPNEYLCWPSPDQERIIALLEALQPDQDQHPPYPVRYLSDGEQILAHVALTSELRLVFRWGGPDGWGYHDVKLMPFPPGCYHSLPDASNTKTSVEDTSVLPPTSHDLDDDDNSYWNSYGRDADEQDLTAVSSTHSQEDGQVDSEDAYWAQYSNVQGTADSTVPSPLPRNRPKLDTRTDPLAETSHEHISIHPESFLYSDALSPDAIIAALNTVIPQECHEQQLSPCSLDMERASGSDFTMPTPPSDSTDCATLGSTASSEPLGCDCTDATFPILLKSDIPPQPQCELEAEEALRDTVRAVYRLWRSSRAKHVRANDAEPTEEHGDDKRLFLRIVQESIDVLLS